MIKLDNICKKYGDIYAIKNVNLQIKNQEVVAIIGPSGGGKSTLLRCINFLETPTSGNVYIENQMIRNDNLKLLRLKIGMVFQHFNLFPHMTVKENLIYAPLHILHADKIKLEKKSEDLLEQFGLKNKINSYPYSLSGGQKQRVAIARSLMMEPKIMLFDEPTSALDPEVTKDIISAILLLKSKITMLIVTHHVKFAEAVADRIIFIDHGQILSDAPTEEFFSAPKSHRAKIFLDNTHNLFC